MNKFYGLLIAATMISVPVSAQNKMACEFTSIASDITSNTTLSASTVYRIEGCIHITSGYTFTIPAGTVVLFEKASSAGLIVDKGAYLNIQGMPGAEVVFTSDQKPGFRAAGDYAGLIVNGQATNNFSLNEMVTTNRHCNVNAGGNNDNDSSGVIRYLRIEFPEYVTFASVGRKTVLENIQVSYSENSGFEFWGGAPKARQLVALNAKVNDFEFKFGNRAKIQSALGLRLDPTTHYGTMPNSNGILIANNDAGAYYTATPNTRPVLDKFTLFGPAYCGATGLSSNFKNAILAQHSAQMGIYHSYISGWPTGLRLEDSITLANAVASPQTLKSEANSFDNNTANYSHSGAWPTPSCAGSMTAWITNTGAGTTCGQRYNLLTGIISGYDVSVCENYCGNEIPSFLMSSSEMGETQYPEIEDLDGDPFFTPSDFRGAFDETTDWTADWTLFCPQQKHYCSAERRTGNATNIQGINNRAASELILSPNPATGITYASFHHPSAGDVAVSIVNSTGQVVRSFKHNGDMGEQRIPVDTDRLSTGMYIIRIQFANGQMLYARMTVK